MNDTANHLARCWNDGDLIAGEELCAFCLPRLSHEVGEETAREWLAELHEFGLSKLGFTPETESFLPWAVGRVKRFKNDPYRKLVYSLYSGNENAIDDLYVLVQSDLVQSLSAFRSSLPDGEAIDIVADFFTDLYDDAVAGRHEYIAARGPFLAWARKVVLRRALTFLRRSQRLTSLPEGNEPLLPREFISPSFEEDNSFKQWIASGLTAEQKLVFDLLVIGCEQQDIVAATGFGSAKVSKMLDEIRSRIADRMQSGGYHEALTFALDRVRFGKGMKGLMPRLFLRFVVPMLLDALREDDTWAPLALDLFGDKARDYLWRINPENRAAVDDVAAKIISLYTCISKVDPGHIFCTLTCQMSVEPWGKQLEIVLERIAAPGCAAVTADPTRTT